MMGKSNKALESKPQDDLEVIDMPADMKADETLVNDAELENGDTIFSQDDQPKTLDATQLYLGEIGIFTAANRRRRSLFCAPLTERLRSLS